MSVWGIPSGRLSTPRAVALVLGGAIMLGSAGTAAVFAPVSASSATVGGMRLMIGSAALLAVLPLVGGSCRTVPALLMRPTVWVMAVTSAAYQPLFFGAVDRAGVALSTLIAVGAVPVFAGLLGWLVLGHRPTRLWLLATAVAVTGLIVRSMGQFAPEEGLDGPGVGVLMACTAGFGSGCYMVAAKVGLDRGDHAVEMPAAAYLLGSVFIAPLVLTQPLGWVLSPRGALVALYLGVVTMALANVLPVVGMHSMSAGPASTLLLGDPLTATVLGVLVLGEALPVNGIIGLALVAAGLVLQTVATTHASATRAPRVKHGESEGFPADSTRPPPANTAGRKVSRHPWPVTRGFDGESEGFTACRALWGRF